MTEFKQTARQNILVLIPFFLINTTVFVAFAILFGADMFRFPLLYVVIFVFILNILPVLILHFQYSVVGVKQLTIDENKKSLIFHSSIRNAYKYDDLLKLEYFATHGHISKKGSSGFYTFDPYRFYKFTFRDNKTYYVTCLVINNIENTLEPILGIEAAWKFRAMPLLY